MTAENNDNENDLKEIKTLLKREILKNKNLEEKLKITFEELTNSNTDNLLTLETQISQLQEACNRTEFYKDLFAHDINNILHGILSGLDVCEIIIDNPSELKDSINIMKTQIKRGYNLISNIYNLSKLEEVEIPFIKKDICKILKKSISYVKTVDREREVNIQFDCKDKSLFVQGNDLLEEVFDNILYNAIKHNKNSVVEIKIIISRLKRARDDYLKMEFLDNGKGVSNTRKESIFKRGFGENKNVHGIGLGLSLVKKIMDVYNGEIWVEDRVMGDHKNGSNFILLFPEVK